MQRLLAIAMLVLQGGIALLGSGGLHALPGHQCNHVHPPAERPAAGETHSHHGCSHHHSHDCTAPVAEERPADPRPAAPRPVDSGDCLICQLFLLAGPVPTPVALEGSTPLAGERVPVLTPATVDGLSRGPVSARGPPRA